MNKKIPNNVQRAMSMQYVRHALYNPELAQFRGTLAKLATRSSVKALVSAGCDAATLLDVVALARNAHHYYPDVSSRSMLQLRHNLTATLRSLDILFPSHLSLTPGKGKAQEVEFSPNDEDQIVCEADPFIDDVSELKARLHHLGEMTAGLHDALQAKAILRSSQFKQMTCVLPALYVKEATGSWQYRELSELLRLANWRMDPEHIRRATRNAKAHHSEMMPLMKAAIDHWQTLDSMS